MMHGGAMVRSRKIRIIKNAPMFLLTFPADSALSDTRRIDLERVVDHYTLGERHTAKVAVSFWIQRLTALELVLIFLHNIRRACPSR